MSSTTGPKSTTRPASQSQSGEEIGCIFVLLGILAIGIIIGQEVYRGIFPQQTSHDHLSTAVTATYLANHCLTPDLCGTAQLQNYHLSQVSVADGIGRSKVEDTIYFSIVVPTNTQCPSWQLPQNLIAEYSPISGDSIAKTQGNTNLPTVQSCDIKFKWNGKN